MTNWEKYFGTPERASKMFVAFPASMLSLDRSEERRVGKEC